MAQPTGDKNQPARAARPVDFWRILKEIDLFFEGRGREHKTMRRIAEKLDKAGIPYAIVGGMAVSIHGHEQTTDNVDVLLTPEGFAEFKKRFVPRVYDAVPGRPRRFFDRGHQCGIAVLVTGYFPGKGEGPVCCPNPTEVSEIREGVRVVSLAPLIQLLLAARRFQDTADVISLVRVHNLDESFLPNLHPSLHLDFVECLEAGRREDEWEARQDEQMTELLGRSTYESRES
jgi:hypothetical protein